MSDGFKLAICRRCGKEFLPAPQHVFGKYCTWGCLIADRKEGKEKKSIAKGPPKTCKAVLQYTLTGELVKRYPSCCEAARAVGASRANVYDACRGRAKSCRGYRWEFE